MVDTRVTIGLLKQVMAEFVRDRQWEGFHSPKNLAMGMAIETAELMEHFQWMDLEESREVERDPARSAMVKEELADVFSYVLCMANAMNIDLSEAYLAKMEKNALKYPAEQYRGKWKL